MVTMKSNTTTKFSLCRIWTRTAQSGLKRSTCPAFLCGLIAFSVVTVRTCEAQLLDDDFSDDIVDSRYTAIEGASLSEQGGQLVVELFGVTDGLQIDLADIGSAAACHEVTISTDASSSGDRILWEWVVKDEMDNVFTLLESEWTVGSLIMKTTKKNAAGEDVDVQQKIDPADINGLSGWKTRWDRETRDGVEYVQLEIVKIATGEIIKAYEWQDPPPTTTVSLRITSNLDTFALDHITVTASHTPSDGIPTVSEWGVVVLSLLMLTGIAIKFGRRRVVHA